MEPFCHKITAVLRAVTPIHVGTGMKTGVIKHSHPFIKGAAIRGAIGTALMKLVCKKGNPLKEHEKCEYFEECTYARLFGEEFGRPSKIFFRYAYPLHMNCGGVFRPAPKTLYRCTNPQCRRVYDDFVPRDSCESCGESLKPVVGFRCDRCNLIESLPVRIVRVTLTAVDSSTGAAARFRTGAEEVGTLHTLEAINSGSRFGFEAIAYGVEEPDLEILKRVLERALPDEGIGGSKSRGLGKIAVEGLRVEPIDASTIDERASELEETDFRAELASPMVLKGEMLAAPTLLEGARRAYTLAMRKGKPALPELKLVQKAAEGEVLSGWSLRSDNRRALEAAISAGSVFRFTSGTKSRELAVGLAALEYYAIGSYKPHGCGQVKIKV